MRKTRAAALALGAMWIALLCGCRSEESEPELNQMAYPLDATRDAVITIAQDVAITQNGNDPFTLFDENGDILAQGTFITGEEFEEYKALLESQNGKDGLTLLEPETEEGDTNQVLYQYDPSADATAPETASAVEYVCIAMIDGSNYGYMIGSTQDESTAMETFENITVTVEDRTETENTSEGKD